MPELPEVENIVRELKQKTMGLTFRRISILHEEISKTPRQTMGKKIPQRKIISLSRRGKYIRFGLNEENTLWFHLGMTGQLVWRDETVKDPHLHVVMEFLEIPQKLVFRDIRKFGEMFLTNGNLESLPEGVRRLGPEPFEISEKTFIETFRQRSGRIKSLLLNQRILAGLGNIYADESLHRAGIDPRRRPNRLKSGRLKQLYQSIRETLEEAIKLGGSSIDDYIHSDGSRGFFQNFHRVYGRFGLECVVCKTAIRKIKLAGRSASFCPQCQT
ncbi:MAG: bifunctional DNA-formamidopyrimidine glycosylase/DNA-(apurinic or apyrimidinic site) lyase [Candidatus Omnitrophica bacterium]|nr:bifunctional DNA-formamidopyrimidine glycosylase/DNA-(apurinic or apyrimidinic site) lyase [Candidatus Omnitrophota bacterium]